MMSKDLLFLLPPGFEDNDRREFCPECAELWGVLHYYPAIKEALEICYVGIHHPREPICAVLGEGRWNAPTLVLNTASPLPKMDGIKTSNERSYLGSARHIANYFGIRFGIARPRGSWP